MHALKGELAFGRAGAASSTGTERDSSSADLDDLRTLAAPTREAIQTLERCIASHRVVDVDYTDAAGHNSTIRIQPAFIRVNQTKHVVLWAIATDEGNWEQLWLERITDVRDTGEEFTPSW